MRYYNSLATSDNYLEYNTLTALGYNCRGFYDRSVEEVASDPFPTVEVRRADGQVLFFSRQGGAWVSDSDVVGRLEQLTDAAGEPSGWRYVNGNDEVQIYDAAGKLTSITDRSGFAQTPSYDADGRLQSVTEYSEGVTTLRFVCQNASCCLFLRAIALFAAGGLFWTHPPVLLPSTIRST